MGKIGGLPAADELAVAGKHLDLRCHIDDVKEIVLIDGDRPRAKQTAGCGTDQAPNLVQASRLGAAFYETPAAE